MSLIDDARGVLSRFASELANADHLLGEGFSNHDRGQVLESVNGTLAQLDRVPPATETPAEPVAEPAAEVAPEPVPTDAAPDTPSTDAPTPAT